MQANLEGLPGGAQYNASRTGLRKQIATIQAAHTRKALTLAPTLTPTLTLTYPNSPNSLTNRNARRGSGREQAQREAQREQEAAQREARGQCTESLSQAKAGRRGVRVLKLVGRSPPADTDLLVD